VADIMMALSLSGVRVPVSAAAATGTGQPGTAYDGPDRDLYQLLSQEPVSLDWLARESGLDLPALCGGLERLATAGVARDVGGWWERT
jgi:hypothetical protein